MTRKPKQNSVVAGHDIASQITLQAMVWPAIIIVICMSYFPMYGIQIAFKNYDIFNGINPAGALSATRCIWPF